MSETPKHRAGDLRIPETVEGIIRELYIRLDGLIETVADIKIALNGNGQPGLVKEHEIVKQKIKYLEVNNMWVRNWIGSSVLVLVLAVGGFIFGYGQLYNKVDNLSKEMQPPIECK